MGIAVIEPSSVVFMINSVPTETLALPYPNSVNANQELF